ncbi:hypothetical protein SAMN05444487_104161 [Marininema mesophilum]|uniref:AAA domain-containing protein n=1 Tax=Marininema mesophilum TaxID=1048340 RepID=A0A1H2UNC4_9BACL|nr:ATP-binding protein [Marininema mesophilum]SDW57592.1 hypothetical protein SAMN05444487_104161 [Marininema mesophilum]
MKTVESKHIAFVGGVGIGKTYHLQKKFKLLRAYHEDHYSVFVPDQSHQDYYLIGAEKINWNDDKPQETIDNLVSILNTSKPPVTILLDALPAHSDTLSLLFNHPTTQIIMTSQEIGRIFDIKTNEEIQINFSINV